MLDPAKLSPQSRLWLQTRGAKTDHALSGTELARAIRPFDRNADGQLSAAEAAPIHLPAADRQLINAVLREGSSLTHLDLQLDPDGLAEPTPEPKIQPFAAPAVTPLPAARPAPAPRSRFGSDVLFIEAKPQLKADSMQPDAAQTLEKLGLHGQGQFGAVQLNSDLQIAPSGEAQASSASVAVDALPGLRLGAKVDTLGLSKGEMPQGIDFSGEGRLGALNYASTISYGSQGVATRGQLGYRLSDGFSVGVQGAQQESPKGLALKDVGLTTRHQFGALSLGSQVSYDTVSGKSSAGGNLGYQLSGASRVDLDGSSDGSNAQFGFKFISRF